MIHINTPFSTNDFKSLDKLDLPQNIKSWLVKAKEHEKVMLDPNISLEEKYEYLGKKSSCWQSKNLMFWLRELSHNKCWYSEAKFAGDSAELEHWRPKKGTNDLKRTKIQDGYYWLAFNLTNYRLTKGKLNRVKGNYFPLVNEQFRSHSFHSPHTAEKPLFLDPISPMDYQCLSFNDRGEATANTGVFIPKAKDKAELTIKHFGLNSPCLVLERKTLWSTVRYQYNEYIKCLDMANNGCPVSEIKAETHANEILYLVHESSAFSSTAKAALRTLGEAAATAFANSPGKPRLRKQAA
ncbi:conserved hypothetical protein [Vibrio chagasii]|nr:conserved hypothetical protein [Vibrio chagasii]CAH6852091.1 conserved hypothetical protein [Vibrio chagasii]CAH6878098.1 conserved hypothetical protein [Vibrio chagasii]CAH7030904.1 conserved hypothetical protein [Vibrio chagasii]CAH7128610.1 conserved hypothetical protein [Vibrio chagasii]